MDKVKSTLMVCLVLGLFLGQSRANFQDCYKSCLLLCVVTPGQSFFPCTFKCLKDCIKLPANGLGDSEYFCKLGCATSLCSNIGSKSNPDEKRVAGCVDSCSAPCSSHV